MIIKQTVGNAINLGGKLEEIEPLNFSCFNFCNNFNSDLTELSPEFYYFTINSEDYIHARTKNIWWNWNYNNPEGTASDRYKRTKMARRLSELKAIRELNDYPEEIFIKNNQNFESHIYSFGAMPKDLYKVNDEVKEEKLIYLVKISEENDLTNE